MPVRDLPVMVLEKLPAPGSVAQVRRELAGREHALRKAMTDQQVPVGKREEARFRIVELRKWRSRLCKVAVTSVKREMEDRAESLLETCANEALPVGTREEARVRLGELRNWRSRIRRLVE